MHRNQTRLKHLYIYPIHHNTGIKHSNFQIIKKRRTFTVGRPPYVKSGYLTGNFRKLWPRCASSSLSNYPSGSVTSDIYNSALLSEISHLSILHFLKFFLFGSRKHFLQQQNSFCYFFKNVLTSIIEKHFKVIGDKQESDKSKKTVLLDLIS